jgi:hypothetical protein
VLFDGEIPSIPRIRLSGDLRTWTQRKPDHAGIQGGVNWALAADDEAYVLAGNGLFRSADGRHWTRGHAAKAAMGRLDADSVASDGRRFVAWQGTMGSGGVWASPDGRTWRRVRLPGAPAVIIDSLAARPGGGFVAAGRIGATVAELDAQVGEFLQWETLPGTQAVWTSRDGTTWKRVAVGDRFARTRLTDVAAGGPGGGIVALGLTGEFGRDSGEDLEVTAWRWTSGGGWHRLQGRAFAIVEADPGTARILAARGRWLVVGARTDATARHPGTIGGSDDGARWWAVEPRVLGTDPRAYYIDAVASVPGRLAFLVNGGGVDARPIRVWASP